MVVRRARPSDLDVIMELIVALADYEKAADQVRITPAQLKRSLFGPEPRVFCDLVETGGTVHGFAVWFLNYSTWTGAHGIFLEDLFVRPEQRGRGYGKELLQHLARECVAQDYRRLEWSVLDWNKPSIDFYRSLGAVPLEEWTNYRVSGEHLARLASGEAL